LYDHGYGINIIVRVAVGDPVGVIKIVDGKAVVDVEIIA